jgi:peptidoglycan/LPS O-acetylase OafA/YrhL
MIQRIQSLWLFLAAVCGVLAFYLPFYSGQRDYNGQLAYAELTATYDIPIILCTALAVAGAVYALFSYSKRKQQFAISLVAMVVAIIAIVLMFLKTSDFVNGQMSLGAICVFLLPVFLFLAARGIRNDDKLVKSMDRLR